MRTASSIALVAIALAALLACRCSGGLSGSVNDAGFSIGTPPSAPTTSASGGPSSTTKLFQREHDRGRCPPPEARSLHGTQAAGAECNKADECAPICCTCAGSAVSWLAAVCIDGQCADRGAACAEPPSGGFCDEPHVKSTSTSHSNFRCGAKTAGKKPGEACDEGVECAATCCPCDGNRSWSASACVNGACASPSVTCAVSPMGNDYCGESPKKISRSVRGEQKDEKCPEASSELSGKHKSGEGCESFADCAPSCCECGNGRAWLGAACVNGRCAPSAITCLETESTGSYCGRPCRGEGAPCWRDGECCSGSCSDEKRCRGS